VRGIDHHEWSGRAGLIVLLEGRNQENGNQAGRRLRRAKGRIEIIENQLPAEFSFVRLGLF
jgi:hypothetical protein